MSESGVVGGRKREYRIELVIERESQMVGPNRCIVRD